MSALTGSQASGGPEGRSSPQLSFKRTYQSWEVPQGRTRGVARGGSKDGIEAEAPPRRPL